MPGFFFPEMLEILVAVAAPPSSVTLFVSMQLFDKRLLTIHQPKASFHTPPRLYSEPIQDWAFRFRFLDRLMASFRWVSVHSPATSHPQVCLNRWCNVQLIFRQRVLIEYGSKKATIIKPSSGFGYPSDRTVSSASMRFLVTCCSCHGKRKGAPGARTRGCGPMKQRCLLWS